MTLANLSDPQKAATIVISLGSEAAAEVYKYLSEEEIEKLTYEIAKIQKLGSDDVEEILNDFYSLCLTQKVVTEGGVTYARSVLEKAFGAQVANSLLDRVTKSLKTKAFEFIRKSDYKNLMTTIQNENPQTIALILSYARSDQASTIISELPKEVRIDVVERIAKMDRTNPEVVNQVEKVLERKFSSMVSMEFTEVGGINFIADVMNHIDRGSEKYIFDEMYKRDAKLADEIRKKMFIFEDIMSLDGMAIQRFLREVDSKDLVVALKGSNEEVNEVIFQNMSQRMGETVRSDMEYLHNVRMRDVEEAQQRIVAIIRKLEDEGEIVISKGGGDDIIA
ncbi:flagellar motor switch protein FliG [Ruminococcaceae bacterium OttesenSCG-928-L11]|nr:flagellar motor switch protein FliG [Ruminococcaceae bacterium OttesenSCG-928-L11]